MAKVRHVLVSFLKHSILDFPKTKLIVKLKLKKKKKSHVFFFCPVVKSSELAKSCRGKKHKLSHEISSTWKLGWLALIYSVAQLFTQNKDFFFLPRLSIGHTLQCPSFDGINGCLARCFASFVRRNVPPEYRFQLLLFFVSFGEQEAVSIREIFFSRLDLAV